MTLAEEAEAAATAGAMFLDRRVQTWHTLINTDELDMLDAADCVLGQIFGGYFTGNVCLGVTLRSVELGFFWPHEHESPGSVELLNQAWRDQVQLRRVEVDEPVMAGEAT